MDKSCDDICAAIIADAPNYAAEQFFETQLALASKFHTDLLKYCVVSDALIHNIKTECGLKEIHEKLNKGYQVVIAILGVPGSSGYQQDVYRLLDAWQKASQKPILLLVSNNPALTSQMIDSWQGWKALPPALRPAVRVNESYLVAVNGNRALAVLDELMHIALAMEEALAHPRLTFKPHPLQIALATPLMERSAKH